MQFNLTMVVEWGQQGCRECLVSWSQDRSKGKANVGLWGNFKKWWAFFSWYFETVGQIGHFIVKPGILLKSLMLGFKAWDELEIWPCGKKVRSLRRVGILKLYAPLQADVEPLNKAGLFTLTTKELYYFFPKYIHAVWPKAVSFALSLT